MNKNIKKIYVQIKRLLNPKTSTPNNKFILLYQPQIDINTRRIIGAEALIRQIDHNNNLILPIHFIPQAEENNSIQSIDLWVVSEACKQAILIQSICNKEIKISINLSAKTFSNNAIISKIAKKIKESISKKLKIVIELTETTVIRDTEKAIESINLFHNCGIEVALDDFGSGYSSLSYLQDLPIDYIKLDKKLIDHITESEKGEIISENIISMAQKMKIKVIAEGIENENQLLKLEKIGCNYGQGYYISKPITLNDFILKLKLIND